MPDNAHSKPPDLTQATTSSNQVDYMAARHWFLTPESLMSIMSEQLFGLLEAVARLDGLAQTETLHALRSVITHVPPDQRKAIAEKLVDLRIYDTTYQAYEYLKKCPDPPGAAVFPSKSLAELRKLPAKVWDIENIIGTGDLGMIFGPPGSGKTNVVIDAIFSVCTGRQFAHYFKVNRRLNVAYAAGEGLSGLAARFSAAADYYDVDDLDNFFFFPLAPQLNPSVKESIYQFVSECKQMSRNIDLLILDTLHSATVGLDENSAKEMGQALEAAKFAVRELNCAVLLVHHSNKSGTGERGSSALRGAMDVIIEVKPIGTKFMMTCAKLKDGEKWRDQTFDLVVTGTSVRVWWDEPTDAEQIDRRKSETGQQILSLLAEESNRSLTCTQISNALDVKQQSANKVLTRLTREKRVRRSQNTRGTWTYLVTEDGLQALELAKHGGESI